MAAVFYGFLLWKVDILGLLDAKKSCRFPMVRVQPALLPARILVGYFDVTHLPSSIANYIDDPSKMKDQWVMVEQKDRCFAHQKILVHLLFGVICMTFYHGIHHHSIITIFELYPTIHHHPHKMNMYKVCSPSQHAIVTTQKFYMFYSPRGSQHLLFPFQLMPHTTHWNCLSRP